MTHEELVARYRLLAKSQSDGVESWEAVDTETDREVNVHRLSTSRQISILDMMEHLDASERARIVEQHVVDDVPVVVTKPLPRSTTFVEWLQNSVPSTVTSVLRPLTRPSGRPVAAVPTSPPVATNPEGLTAMFLASELNAQADKTAPAPMNAARPATEFPAPATPPPSLPPKEVVAAPPSKDEERRVTPVTPLADLAGGLTEIFSASELLEKIGPDATVKRRALAGPPSAPTPPAPTTPPAPLPISPPTPIKPASIKPASIKPAPIKPAPINSAPIAATPITPTPVPPATQKADPMPPPPRVHRAPPPTPLDAYRVDGGFSEIPEFRLEPTEPARPTPAKPDEPFDSEPPDFRKTFVLPAEPQKPPVKQPRLDQPPPQLGARQQSAYTEIIEGRRTPAMPAKPAVIAPPPPPARQPSILPVVIMVGVLVLAILATLVVILFLNRH